MTFPQYNPDDFKPSPRRKGESLRDAAKRNAIDALYWARDHGGNMHDAGALCAATVADVLDGKHG